MTPTPPEVVGIYPVPYNPAAAVRGTLKFLLPEESDIEIYNAAGYLVFEVKGVIQRFEWDGRNRSGEEAAPGIYFYIIRSASETETGKFFIVN